MDGMEDGRYGRLMIWKMVWKIDSIADEERREREVKEL